MNANKVARCVPMTEDEIQRSLDADWAKSDPEVEKRFAGQWVVPFERRIVAHGEDLEKVLQEAERLSFLPRERLVVCGVPHPESWLADA
jgi:Family of unknown function (DUF5678)